MGTLYLGFHHLCFFAHCFVLMSLSPILKGDAVHFLKLNLFYYYCLILELFIRFFLFMYLPQVILTSSDGLVKYILPEQLIEEYCGSFHYDHFSWFRMRIVSKIEYLCWAILVCLDYLTSKKVYLYCRISSIKAGDYSDLNIVYD